MIAEAEKPLAKHEAYHSNFSRDSHSSLQLFRRSVTEYAAIRIFRTQRPEASSPELLLGSAVHCAFLEPAELPKRYSVAPKCDRRTKDGKSAWTNHMAEANGRDVITAQQMTDMAGMAAGIRANPKAYQAMTVPAVCEEPIFWTDDDTGLPLKCMPDRLIDGDLIVDLKTTSDGVDPETVGKTIARFGYHRQAAFYLDGLKAATGVEGTFLWVFVLSSPPYSSVVVKLGDDDIEQGRHENRATLRELAERKRENNWQEAWFDKIVEVSLPRWAKR